jgi:hypothetical protein
MKITFFYRAEFDDAQDAFNDTEYRKQIYNQQRLTGNVRAIYTEQDLKEAVKLTQQ